MPVTCSALREEAIEAAKAQVALARTACGAMPGL
jgi:hypothetical protein